MLCHIHRTLNGKLRLIWGTNKLYLRSFFIPHCHCLNILCTCSRNVICGNKTFLSWVELKGRTDDLRSPVTLSRHLPSFLGPWVVTYFQCVISFLSSSSLQEYWYQLNLCYIDKRFYSKRKVLPHSSSQNDSDNTRIWLM